MPQFSSYALQFVNFTAASLSATGAELLIVESGVTSALGAATLTPGQLAALQAQGRQVLGYVNTSVTDANRAYWTPAWVTPTNPAEPDVGVVSPTAPLWLQNNYGTVDFNPAYPGPEAILVDYRDPDWRALVVAQAVAVVQAGFHGVFLDDVARYFQAGYAGDGYDPTLANSMMQLVLQVATAIRAIDPDAKVVVNSGVYIAYDSTGGPTSALFTDYRNAIDGVLIENQFITESDPVSSHVLSDAAALFPGVDIMPLENRASGVDVEALLAFAGQMGMVPYISPDESYAFAAPAVKMGSGVGDVMIGTGNRANLMAGLWGNDSIKGGNLADEMYGHGDNDTLIGAGGDDLLAGGAGLDSLYGGAGNDFLTGGDDADQLFGSLGGDLLIGSGGNDRLLGQAGDDTLEGGLGNDLLNGGDGADVFVFAASAGIDRISAFDRAVDRIDLSAFATTFAAVQVATVVKSWGLEIDLTSFGGSGKVQLVGAGATAPLVLDDFIL